MSERERVIAEIRQARDAYNSAEAERHGFKTGPRAHDARLAEAHLRVLLWRHRDILITVVIEQTERTVPED